MIIEHPVEWHPEHRQSKKKMVIKEQLKHSLRQWWMDKVSAILAWVLIKEDVHNLWLHMTTHYTNYIHRQTTSY